MKSCIIIRLISGTRVIILMEHIVAVEEIPGGNCHINTVSGAQYTAVDKFKDVLGQIAQPTAVKDIVTI